MAVNDAHSRFVLQRRVIQEFVQAIGSLFHRHSDHLDFVGGQSVARRRMHGDAGNARKLRGGDGLSGWALDAGDFLQRHFHAQRPGFDFRGRAVQSPKNHRLAESSHPNFRAGLQPVRADGFPRRSRGAKIGLGIRNRLRHRGIPFFARLAAGILHLPPRALFEVRAQFAFLHRFDDTRDVFIKAPLHLCKLRFEFFDALLLAFHPLRPQFLAFLFQGMPLRRHLLLQAAEFVAAAVQIGDEVCGFARFRGQQRAGAFNDALGHPQPLRHGNATRAARDTHHQAVGRPQVHVVEFNRGIHDTGRRGSVSFQPVVMRSRQDEAISGAKFIEQRHRERRTLFGGRSRSHFIHKRE